MAASDYRAVVVNKETGEPMLHLKHNGSKCRTKDSEIYEVPEGEFKNYSATKDIKTIATVEYLFDYIRELKEGNSEEE